MTTRLTNESINSLIEEQLAAWPEAKENFFRLGECRRHSVDLGDWHGAVQLNPARIRSTGAKVDARSISERPCFLCEANRPKEQITVPWISGWQLLVNPFPILPVHFTIVHPGHVAQAEIPLEMAAMAEAAPDLVIFFNGAKAGASAPDHRHVQAVLKSELPLVRLAEQNHPSSRGGWMSSEEFGLDLPFHFMSAVVTPDTDGMKTLVRCMSAFGIDKTDGHEDAGLLNAFMWIGCDVLLRIVVVPRRAHRPDCWYAPDDERIMVSPGAIDMAGILITPMEKDFQQVDDALGRRIYADVAFANHLPEQIKSRFLS
ncbi:MAG: DUF4922 domain-containing protein [Muribaculaceae bacterium]|nr:DUF4922 domain-containing protein [Muribaculaceae bacterium]